jgi:hypothetical protein
MEIPHKSCGMFGVMDHMTSTILKKAFYALISNHLKHNKKDLVEAIEFEV